jgi:hypothetical protein
MGWFGAFLLLVVRMTAWEKAAGMPGSEWPAG